MLALLCSVLLGQTVFEWEGPMKESHFTEDPSRIPKRAHWRVYKAGSKDAGVQTFEWTDEKGKRHLTTDPEKVPQGVEFRLLPAR
jgi:hypothetical protein